ncbi:MAG: hypothetical protein WCR84_03545, partial [Candidatus Paceibacterota bacterium]
HSFSPHPFFCPPRPSELAFGARSAPSVPLKKGSRIFKQRALELKAFPKKSTKYFSYFSFQS